MGLPMAGRILEAGYTLNVYSRTASRCSKLVEAGATLCGSAAEVADSSDIIFTMVGTPDEVKAVYFDEDGLLAGDIGGKLFVDMSTTAPSLSIQIYYEAKDKDADAVDAPVSGGDVGACNGSLSIMAGGDEEVVAKLEPLFALLGNVRYMGKAGNGQHTKMCNQLTVAGTMIGVCEALVYAERSGLDCEAMIEAIRPGAAGCWTLDNLAPRIIRDDYEPGFMVDHFVKDLGLALQQAELSGMNLPGLTLAKKMYEHTQAIGLGQSGTQALVKTVRALSEK